MAFEKITDTSLANKGVTGLPDVPGLTTAEMQAKFDELSRDVIIPKLNEIVDGLNGDEVGLSSKIENPETKEKDVIQNVVNAIYQIVKENSDKRHGHENKETLDKVTAELYDSINTLVSMFNGISAVDKTVTADDTKIPTSGAIVNYAIALGAGDMQKAIYDKNSTGIVDDAEKLGGVAPEEYLQKASLPDTTVAFEVAETRSNISTGEKVSTVFGKIKKFFADLTAPAFAQMITTKEDLLATKVTGYVPDAKAVADGFADVNGKLTNTYAFLYGNYFAANVTNTVELKDNFQNYKLLLFVCNNGTSQMYAPTVYPASYIKEIYDSVKNGQYLGKYPSITTFIGSTISGSFIPVADNKFKLTTGMSGTFMILGLK